MIHGRKCWCDKGRWIDVGFEKPVGWQRKSLSIGKGWIGGAVHRPGLGRVVFQMGKCGTRVCVWRMCPERGLLCELMLSLSATVQLGVIYSTIVLLKHWVLCAGQLVISSLKGSRALFCPHAQCVHFCMCEGTRVWKLGCYSAAPLVSLSEAAAGDKQCLNYKRFVILNCCLLLIRGCRNLQLHLTRSHHIQCVIWEGTQLLGSIQTTSGPW